MDVTVAIITRNRADLLNQCLGSLVKQMTNKFKVLIIDNASSDQTKKIIESFNDKLNIKYVLEKNVGRAHARNKVLENINKGILATVDDDCILPQNWIKNIKKSHSDFPKATVIQGWVISYPTNSLISLVVQFNKNIGFIDNIIHNDKPKFYNQGGFLESCVARPILLIDTKNVSFKVKNLKKLGIHFNPQWKHGEDFEFSKHLLERKNSILFDPRIFVYHSERSSIRDFLKQRFVAGGVVMKTRLSYPNELFPKRNKLWFVERIISLMVYVLCDIKFSSVLIIPLYVLERTTYILGGYRVYLIDRNVLPDILRQIDIDA